jgi:hypothetical protein
MGVDSMRKFGAWIVLPLLLSGCLTSKGRFLPVNTATTPLPAGQYYRIEPGDKVSTLTGPIALSIQGTTYAFADGKDIMKFQMIPVVAGKDIYVVQEDPGLTGPQLDAAKVGILIGPVTEDGFCDYSDPANGLAGVNRSGDIASKPQLKAWLVSHVDMIAKMKRGVCWVKLTPNTPAGKPPSG